MTVRAALWGMCTWKKKLHFHRFYILTCIHVFDDSSRPWLHLRGRGDPVGEVSVTIKQWTPADSGSLWSDTGQFESHKFLRKKKKKSNVPFYSMQHERELLSKYPGGGWRCPPSVTENCLYNLQLVCLILLNCFLHQATFLRGPEWHQTCHFLSLF